MTANEIDHALGRPPEDVGPALLRLAEDQWFDRKSAKLQPRALAKPLVALANAEGGVLVIGLDAPVVEGVDSLEPKRLNDLRQAAIDHTSPPVRASFELVECLNSDENPDHLLVIRVQPSERVHETNQGDCYLRVGDESRKLTNKPHPAPTMPVQ